MDAIDSGADIEEFEGINICDLSVHMSFPTLFSALVVQKSFAVRYKYVCLQHPAVWHLATCLCPSSVVFIAIITATQEIVLCIIELKLDDIIIYYNIIVDTILFSEFVA